MENSPVEGVTLKVLKDAWDTVKSSPLGVINTPMISGNRTTLPLNTLCNFHMKMENLQRTGLYDSHPDNIDHLNDRNLCVAQFLLDEVHTWKKKNCTCFGSVSLSALCYIFLSIPGSFKIRGVANQFARKPTGIPLVTMSAGNYGKAFAYALKHYGCKGKVVMPETAPASRSTLIEVSLPTACGCYCSKVHFYVCVLHCNALQSLGAEVERVPSSHLLDVVNRCVLQEKMTFLHSIDDIDLIAGHSR